MSTEGTHSPHIAVHFYWSLNSKLTISAVFPISIVRTHSLQEDTQNEMSQVRFQSIKHSIHRTKLKATESER